MSFSMLYFSRATVAISTASCCISSLMSTFLITALGPVPLGAEEVSVDEDVGASSFSDIALSVWMRRWVSGGELYEGDV